MSITTIHIMLIELSSKLGQFSKSKCYRESSGVVEGIFQDATLLSKLLKDACNSSTNEAHIDIIQCAAQRVAIAMGDFSGARYWAKVQQDTVLDTEYLNDVLEASGNAQVANLRFAIALLKALNVEPNNEVCEIANEFPPSNNLH